MPVTPEDKARQVIDAKLTEAGWDVQDADALNLAAGSGIAVREFPQGKGHGEADYLLYVNRRALGVVEAKKEGDTLLGVEVQTEKYGAGLPPTLPAWQRPLPFLVTNPVPRRFVARAETVPQVSESRPPHPRRRLACGDPALGH